MYRYFIVVHLWLNDCFNGCTKAEQDSERMKLIKMHIIWRTLKPTIWFNTICIQNAAANEKRSTYRIVSYRLDLNGTGKRNKSDMSMV